MLFTDSSDINFLPRLISLFRDMINRIAYFQTMNPSSFRSLEHKATFRTDVAIGCLCQVAMLKLAREQHRREVCNARLQVTVCNNYALIFPKYWLENPLLCQQRNIMFNVSGFGE